MINKIYENNTITLEYIVNKKVVSFIKFNKSFETIDIIDVFTNSSYRKKGYASNLFSELFKLNATQFFLEVRENNIAALNLYKKNGFKEIDRREKYYNDEDAIIMVKKKDINILAVESSCDETSVSIVKNGLIDVSTVINSQIDIHKNYGGVVPEIASRKHLENFTMVLDQALKQANMSLNDIDAFACTYGPGLLGSLLVGLESTKTLSLIYNKPFIKVNHMMGHIYANKINNELKFPLLALVISGGHTDLIKMNSELDFEYIGRTLDDAIGECFDKVARILGLSYPGGPNVEKLALKGKPTYKMPNLLINDKYNFSFSGIKSFVNNLCNNEKQRGNEINKNDLACSFQNAVTNQLVSKTRNALKDYNLKTLIVAGGVASSSFIRSSLEDMCKKENVDFNVPKKLYCTDNATMIGAAAYPLYIKGDFSQLDTDAKSNLSL